MRIPPPRRFQNRDRERGAVMMVVALLGLGLISVSFMSISMGQAFLSRGYLQTIADSAARAAVIALKSGGSRSEAREAADTVAMGIRAVERSHMLAGRGDVEFGEFDHVNRKFTTTLASSGGTHSPAVRVWARRTEGSFAGPIELLLGGVFQTPTIDVEAHAVASTGCREIVFAVDASTGMEQEIDRAYGFVEEFILEMKRSSNLRPGDKVGITSFAADALSMRDYADAGGASWSRPVPEELSPIPTNENDIEHWISAMGVEGNYCEEEKDKLPTRDEGSCLGKGHHWGIYRAIEMFEQVNNRCSSPGERLIVLITDDVPCRRPGYIIDDMRTRYYGGTAQQAYDAADAAYVAGIHIAPVLIDRGTNNDCKIDPKSPPPRWPSKQQFIRNMERGRMGRSRINPPDVNSLLSDINDVLFVRLVE